SRKYTVEPLKSRFGTIGAEGNASPTLFTQRSTGATVLAHVRHRSAEHHGVGVAASASECQKKVHGKQQKERSGVLRKYLHSRWPTLQHPCSPEAHGLHRLREV